MRDNRKYKQTKISQFAIVERFFLKNKLNNTLYNTEHLFYREREKKYSSEIGVPTSSILIFLN
jgi:hypothetical protein